MSHFRNQRFCLIFGISGFVSFSESAVLSHFRNRRFCPVSKIGDFVSFKIGSFVLPPTFRAVANGDRNESPGLTYDNSLVSRPRTSTVHSRFTATQLPEVHKTAMKTSADLVPHELPPNTHICIPPKILPKYWQQLQLSAIKSVFLE